jgi:hypothetical protein
MSGDQPDSCPGVVVGHDNFIGMVEQPIKMP